MSLKEKIKSFSPLCLQEEKDKELFLEFIVNNESCLLRDNEAGHITVSAWIVNENRDKVLFCYHNIYDSWSWVGGHADGEENLLSVALKEAREETGVTAKPVSDMIFSLEILPVAEHFRKGKRVSAHTHYNVTFLVEADENAVLSENLEENSGVMWIKKEDIPYKSSEAWMIENVYKKLIERT